MGAQVFNPQIRREKELCANHRPQAPTLVVSAATAVKVYIMLVVALVIAGPRVVDRLPLNLNLPDAAFALTANLIRELDQVQYILLHGVSVLPITRGVRDDLHIEGTPSRRRSRPSLRTHIPSSRWLLE